MSSFVYNEGANQLLGGSINWSSDTIKARLVDAGVTPNKDDAVLTGYTAIGSDVTLGSKTKTKDTTNDRIVYDAADPTFTAAPTGHTASYVLIYKFVTNDGDSIPIAIQDIADTPTNGGDIGITFNASGVFYLQQ